MHSFTRKAVRLSSQHICFRTCCGVIGCRRSKVFPSVPFQRHLSTPPSDPADPANASWNYPSDPGSDAKPEQNNRALERDKNPRTVGVAGTDNAESTANDYPEGNEGNDCTEPSSEKPSRAKDRSGSYGSAVRRAGRNVRRGREPPAIVIPSWFLERNVRLSGETGLYSIGLPLEGIGSAKSQIGSGQLGNEQIPSKEGTLESASFEKDIRPDNGKTNTGDDAPKEPFKAVSLTPIGNYEIDHRILEEISVMISAGLRPSSVRFANSYPASKPHLLLNCPQHGGSTFLDTVVNHTAKEQGADVIRIDAQDIAEIAGETTTDLVELSHNAVQYLGYETYLTMSPQGKPFTDESSAVDEEDEDGPDISEEPNRNRPSNFTPTFKGPALPIVTIIGSSKISELFNSRKFADFSMHPSRLHGAGSDAPAVANTQAFLLLEAFLDSAQAKKKLQQAQTQIDKLPDHGSESLPTASSTSDNHPLQLWQNPSNLIMLVKDYAELHATSIGRLVLGRLHEVVRRRRKEGYPILIVGTTSSEDVFQDFDPPISKVAFKDSQNDPGLTTVRTIVVPCSTQSANIMFASDERAKIQHINTRHLQDMIRKVASNTQQVTRFVSQPTSELGIESTTAYASGLDETIWSFDRVHRAAMMIIGHLDMGVELTSKHIDHALLLLDSSDNAKFDWVSGQRAMEKKTEADLKPDLSNFNSQATLEARIKRLRRTCNNYEKKLLGGVVDAESIRTTFSDVQASKEVLETLKTLTSLSLMRPDAFTYGILATDKIPGILLYGPPGTGKSLLAKAVAKESGACVLEVSGSDVYDMYVGEGEKNVRAVFSLAKKLSPCIVFIDEADAIFGSRSMSINRTSHRELINQFLKEWDGINDSAALIMVATNRPFDLDDAILRRLPRRLLIDLPTEKDREAILRIHLKDEVLDPSLSLSELAAQTPFYSGSDLKNLSVAAALICVREEIDFAMANISDTPHSLPRKRILCSRHFEKAIDEISASINEDMSSLSAIRKFDEKYGDRKGRKKKTTGYGFGTRTEAERSNIDLVRVRS
jgi:SpoVK/Ycf46/Vps4 family AAA+-type ATPase